MPSLFYKAIFERRFALPFLFFEDLEETIKALDEGITDEQLEESIRSSLKRCLGMKKISVDDVHYVSTRLEEDAREQAEEKPPEEPKSKKQAFATSFATWVTELSPHEICLLISDYDYEKALELYRSVDKSDVKFMSTQWVEREWERVRVGYESVVYGFGGGYDDKTPVAADVDVSTDDYTQGKAIDKKVLESVGF